MAQSSYIAARPLRAAVALAAAFALLLPLPARCAACALNPTACNYCTIAAESHRNATSASPARSCCNKPHSSAPRAASPADSASTQSHHSCGCAYQSMPRSTSTVAKLSLTPELTAGLIPANALPGDITINSQTVNVLATASLPPPVPHRILHCTWII